MKTFIIIPAIITSACTFYFLSVNDVPAATFCLICFLGIVKK